MILQGHRISSQDTVLSLSLNDTSGAVNDAVYDVCNFPDDTSAAHNVHIACVTKYSSFIYRDCCSSSALHP